MAEKFFSIDGAREVNRVLKELPGKMGERALGGALGAAAKPLVEEMKQAAPVRQDEGSKFVRRQTRGRFAGANIRRRPGFLRNSIRARRRRIKGALAALVEVGPFGVWYAHLVEWGTRHSRARPFARPALDRTGGEIIKKMGLELGKRVEREAQRLAGKYSKSGLVSRRRRR